MRIVRIAAEIFGYVTAVYLCLQGVGSYLDREDAAARKLGYYSAADRSEALAAGVREPAEWYNRKIAAHKKMQDDARAAELAAQNLQRQQERQRADEAARQRAEEAQAVARKEAACKTDLQCWGEKGIIEASVYCKSQIAKLAKYDIKWTDAWYEKKFSRFRWSNKEKGIVTYIGDKAQFQNGFGAYQNVVYTCDMIPGDKDHNIFNTSVDGGRLD